MGLSTIRDGRTDYCTEGLQIEPYFELLRPNCGYTGKFQYGRCEESESSIGRAMKETLDANTDINTVKKKGVSNKL